MKNTRKVLVAMNTELRAQIAACGHETRKGLMAKLAEARKKAERLQLENNSMAERIKSYEAQSA